MRQVLKTIRERANWWVARQTQGHLQAIRSFEIELVIQHLEPGQRILDLGAGDGWQSKLLADAGFEVSALDLPKSGGQREMHWPVMPYDGRKLPFESETFDVIFSSNVLEHIEHIREMQAEFLRVLRPEGKALHVLPTPSWRFWTNITQLLKCWSIPNTHGAIAGNAISEIYYFSQSWWRAMFRSCGWKIQSVKPLGLFYTGHSILDDRFRIATRQRTAQLLGSATVLYILHKSDLSAPAHSIPN